MIVGNNSGVTGLIFWRVQAGNIYFLNVRFTSLYIFLSSVRMIPMMMRIGNIQGKSLGF